MATGEKGWSSAGKQAVKYDRSPIAPGEYDLKLDGGKAEVKKKNEPGSLPYVNCQFRALGTAKEEGGKDRVVFHRLWLGLYKEKDGVRPVERAQGLNGMLKAVGEDADFPSQRASKKGKDGALTQVEILDPKAVVAWLKDHDGAVFRAQVKIKKQKDFDDQNEITYFVESETGAAEPGDSEVAEDLEETGDEEVSEELEAAESTEEAIEELEEELEEEAADEEIEADMTDSFNPKVAKAKAAAAAAAKAKAPPAKVKQGPAGKGKPGKK